MILEGLAAIVVAAAAPPPDAQPATSVAPLTVAPEPKNGPPPAATINVPMDDSAMGQFASVWPESAYRARISGHVVLSCDIDRHGLAEWCKVFSEKPLGQGFGAAAVQLRPTFKLKPAQDASGPIDQVMNIAIEFKAPNPQIDWGANREGGSMGEKAGSGSDYSDITMSGDPLVRRSIAMLNNPVWTSTVSYEDLMRAYPSKAAGVEGYAVAHCEVSRKGGVSGCQVIKEDPEKRGFGRAAVSLASKFRVSTEWASAPGHADLWVDIPIRFPAPGVAEDRAVTSPYWVAGFDPDQVLKVYPPEAQSKGVTTGHGTAKCIVAEDGSLTDCAPAEANPDGLGFSEAAAKLASTMKMNPWTDDGAPVDGAVVRVGVQLTLKSQQ
ncbi:MAG: TonB family protein [Caulobacterales bacterium]